MERGPLSPNMFLIGGIIEGTLPSVLPTGIHGCIWYQTDLSFISTKTQFFSTELLVFIVSVGYLNRRAPQLVARCSFLASLGVFGFHKAQGVGEQADTGDPEVPVTTQSCLFVRLTATVDRSSCRPGSASPGSVHQTSRSAA